MSRGKLVVILMLPWIKINFVVKLIRLAISLHVGRELLLWSWKVHSNPKIYSLSFQLRRCISPQLCSVGKTWFHWSRRWVMAFRLPLRSLSRQVKVLRDDCGALIWCRYLAVTPCKEYRGQPWAYPGEGSGNSGTSCLGHNHCYNSRGKFHGMRSLLLKKKKRKLILKRHHMFWKTIL